VRIDVDSKEVRCIYKEFDLGEAAAKALIPATVSYAEKTEYWVEGIHFLCAAAEQNVEWSLLKFSILCTISCFVPNEVVSHLTLSEIKDGWACADNVWTKSYHVSGDNL